MTVSAEDRARRIKIILFDVDGVLTDGTIWILSHAVALPDGSITTKMVEAKGFSAHDGAGMTLARLGGMKVGVITKAHQRDGCAARARPEARVCLPGPGIQDEGGARDCGKGGRDAGRDCVCGR